MFPPAPTPNLLRVARLLLALAAGVGGGFAQGAEPALIGTWRVIEPWSDPMDNGKELFTHGGSILTWDAMRNVTPASPLGQYLEQVRRWGFNGFALHSCDLEADPVALQAFCRYLKGLGLAVFIRREWCEPETGKSYPNTQGDAHPRSSPLLNPYNPEVRAYWARRIARDFELVPDLAGYRIWGTEFYFANGAPWMGEGNGMAGRTGHACARDAIRLVAELLAARRATLFWEACQDDPWGQRQEFHYFQDLAGEIPANAFVVIKDYYWDYHPRWPRHPLNGRLKKDGAGRAPYLTSIQLPGEYTGVNDFPFCQVEHVAEVLRDLAAGGQEGLWVMDQPLPASPWDHPLNGINWHAVGRLLRDPGADPAALKQEWAASEFGAAAAGDVLAVIEQVTSACRGMYEFDALWTGNHSRFPTLEYLDSHLCGPYRQIVRMKGMMGFVLPLDMYPPETAARIRSDPRTRMVFNQVPITPQLKAEAMAQKDGAVASMREALARWEALRGRIEAPRHTRILAGLKANLNDTLIFRAMMDLYFDWKLGALTDAKIDAALESCRGLVGACVPDPLDPAPAKVTSVAPASLKTFAEQLRRDLHEPWVEEYWLHHLKGAGVVDPLTWGKRPKP